MAFGIRESKPYGLYSSLPSLSKNSAASYDLKVAGKLKPRSFLRYINLRIF
jgi:hypothetical protein